jgi:hypothetical protein
MQRCMYFLMALLATQFHQSSIAQDESGTITHNGNEIRLVGASREEGKALAEAFDEMNPMEVLNVSGLHENGELKELFREGWPEMLQNITTIRKANNILQIGFGGKLCEYFTISVAPSNCGNHGCDFEPILAQWRVC